MPRIKSSTLCEVISCIRNKTGKAHPPQRGALVRVPISLPAPGSSDAGSQLSCYVHPLRPILCNQLLSEEPSGDPPTFLRESYWSLCCVLWRLLHLYEKGILGVYPCDICVWSFSQDEPMKICVRAASHTTISHWISFNQYKIFSEKESSLQLNRGKQTERNDLKTMSVGKKKKDL